MSKLLQNQFSKSQSPYKLMQTDFLEKIITIQKKKAAKSTRAQLRALKEDFKGDNADAREEDVFQADYEQRIQEAQRECKEGSSDAAPLLT